MNAQNALSFARVAQASRDQFETKPKTFFLLAEHGDTSKKRENEFYFLRLRHCILASLLWTCDSTFLKGHAKRNGIIQSFLINLRPNFVLFPIARLDCVFLAPRILVHISKMLFGFF